MLMKNVGISRECPPYTRKTFSGIEKKRVDKLSKPGKIAEGIR
jgi:hypothetical protein